MMKIIFSLLICLSSLFANSDYEMMKAQYVKSYNYEKMGQYSEAIKALTPLYTQNPTNYTINLRFGWLFYLNKKYNDALKYYQEASLLKSDSLDPKLGMIRIYLDTGKYKEVENRSNEILKLDYYNYYTNLYLAKALVAEKKYEIALSVIQKMLTLYPTNILYLEQLAILYKETNNTYLQELYKEILLLDPNNTLISNQEN